MMLEAQGFFVYRPITVLGLEEYQRLKVHVCPCVHWSRPIGLVELQAKIQNGFGDYFSQCFSAGPL